MSPQTKLEIIHELIEHFFGAPPNPPVAMHNQATAAPIAQGKPMSLNDVIKGMHNQATAAPIAQGKPMSLDEILDANAYIKKLEAENRELSKKLADIDRVLGAGRND